MIVSCGEALVDLVPEPVPGGGPMNVAVAAARLGAPSAFVGRLSTDEHGRRIRAHLLASGVDLGAVETGPEPTATARVEHTPSVVFHFSGEGTADTRLERVAIDRLGPGPHVVHGGTLGLFRGRTADVLAAFVEAHDGVVSLDPNVRPGIIDDRDRWMAYHDRWRAVCYVYRGSDEDIDWIWPGRNLDDVADELVSGRCSMLAITRGGEGVRCYTSSGVVDVPSVPVEVVDTVGAGDSFVGGMLAELWRLGATTPAAVAGLVAAEWREIVAFAARVAAVTCTRPGADPPTRADLP